MKENSFLMKKMFDPHINQSGKNITQIRLNFFNLYAVTIRTRGNSTYEKRNSSSRIASMVKVLELST